MKNWSLHKKVIGITACALTTSMLMLNGASFAENVTFSDEVNTEENDAVVFEEVSSSAGEIDSLLTDVSVSGDDLLILSEEMGNDQEGEELLDDEEIQGEVPVYGEPSGVGDNLPTEEALIDDALVDELFGEEGIVEEEGEKSETADLCDITELEFEVAGELLWAGDALTPVVTIKDAADVELQVGIDYTIAYENNVDVGEATIIVDGIGNYTGTKTLAFQIIKAYIDTLDYEEIAGVSYTGNAQEPAIVIRDNGNELIEGKDYTVSYSNNTNAGSATVLITGIGNYRGTKDLSFSIAPIDISNATISPIGSLPYTGNELQPTVSIFWNNMQLQEETDYQISYSNNLNVGLGHVEITGSGNFTGNQGTSFRIEAKSIKDFDFSMQEVVAWTGWMVRPDINVKNEQGDLLVPGVDYYVLYSNNKDIGSASVSVTGKGNYKDTKSITFRIAYQISDQVFGTVSAQAFTGKPIEPKIKVSRTDGTELVMGEDYELEYLNNVNSGTATIIVHGLGDYWGTTSFDFTINRISIKEHGVGVRIVDPIYTGSTLKPKVEVSLNGTKLERGKDYSVSYGDYVNVGYATLTVLGKGNLTGSWKVPYKIEPRDISDFYFSTSATEEYTGLQIKPRVFVGSENGSGLILNKDYRVTYGNNRDLGDGSVTVIGIGNYTGVKTLSFSIICDVEWLGYYTSNNEAVDTKLQTQTYTGSAIKPKVSPYFYYHGDDEERKLTVGTDYTIVYKNNINVGTATVVITGKGLFHGTQELTFAIKPRSISGMTVPAIPMKTYTGKAIKPAVTLTWGSKTLKKGTDYTVSYKSNTNPGTAVITLTGKGNYKGSKTVRFSIVKNIKDLTFTGPKAQVWSGSKKTPAVTVKWGSKTLVKGTDYTLTYKNNVSVGKATVTVTGKGKYTGTKTLSFRINPVKPYIESIASKKASAFTIEWEKNKLTTKYQIQYGLKSNMDGAKTVAVAGSQVAKTFTGLQKGRVYYVRMRRFRIIDGTRYYSNWTAVRKVTVKKTTPTQTTGGSSGQTTKTRSNIVWVSRTGTKFHTSSSCSNMRSPSQMTLTQAKSHGYTACRKCASGM